MHVPHRANDIPAEFKKILGNLKYDHVFVTGNLTSKEMYDYLRGLTNELHVVSGEFDEIKKWPESKIVTVFDFKFGLNHGHSVVPWGDKESLYFMAKQYECDVLITGNTFEKTVFENNSKLFLNPGTGTGAYSIYSVETIPSFLVLDVKKSNIKIYSYELKDGDVKVSLANYDKT
uniref:Vacuolar protein sorting-associated protein 29 n=1 Tax=Arcella intermedia TaxID=1963864 RepID=A0A6B2LKW1_9EUKA